MHTYLPGTLTLAGGTREDYLALERFHYLGRRPATFAQVVAARFIPAGSATAPPAEDHAAGAANPAAARVVGVAVLSWPVAHVPERDLHLGLGAWRMRDKLLLANREFRTISRVIVHPQFRGIGLAVELVRWLLAHCPTRYVDAMARMGRVHPLFDRAGMRRLPAVPGRPVYYLFDRGSAPPNSP
jgi:GNAT superfamily N-acetyltransferase